jgi:hypothetical protein
MALALIGAWSNRPHRYATNGHTSTATTATTMTTSTVMFTRGAGFPRGLGPRLVRCNEMLAPSQPRSELPQPRRLRETLLVSAVVIGIAAAGLVFLYLVTQGLLLAVHQFL